MIAFASDIDTLFSSFKENTKLQFTQKTFLKEMNQWQEFKGSVCLGKNVITLVYNEPYKQEIFLKEDGIYIYSPEENQIIITDVKDNKFLNRILKLLAGTDVKESFKTKQISKNTVEIIPENQSIKRILIILKDKKIQQIKAEDIDGNKFIIEINKVSSCQPDQFKLPSKAEIIDYRGNR